MSWAKRILIGVMLLAAIVLIVFTAIVPGVVDGRMNTLTGATIPKVEAQASEFHQSLRTVDLHNDFLLWSRNLRRRSQRGHSDLPRLQAGNVRLQVFSAVIRTPRGQNYQHNTPSDAMLPLVIAQGWPLRSWWSDFQRAKFQAKRLRRAQGKSLTLIENQRDLRQLLQNEESTQIGGLLAIEGMQALEGRAENLDRLFTLGYRIFGLAHFFDNRLGGSAHGMKQGGLTAFGRQMVMAIEQRNGIVDLAHASPALIEDVLRVATHPVLVSHTGVRGTCPGPRNLSDGQIRRIAATGGLIGIGFWRGATCGDDVPAIARAIQHAVAIAGSKSVALGSDFDGATSVPFDAAQLSVLTQELLRVGLSAETVRGVMGENALRVLSAQLPESSITVESNPTTS